MACVAAMLAGFVGGRVDRADRDLGETSDGRSLASFAAVLVAGLIIWHMGSGWTRTEDRAKAKAESQQLRRNLAAADAIIRAEPQILVILGAPGPLRIVASR